MRATQQITETKNPKKCTLKKHYPARVTRWCDLIEKYAKKNKLDPNLIAAVILVESGGNPRAYSKNGATGLMQIMASDGLAKEQFGNMFAGRPTMKQLYDPEYNVKWGTQFLARLIKKHGSTRDGLRYYGPSNMGYYYADKVLGAMK